MSKTDIAKLNGNQLCFSLENFMTISKDELVSIQKAYRKEFIVQRLKTITKLIEEDKYQEVIDNYLFYSPAGDCMGLDSYCIDFSISHGELVDTVCDLKESLEILQYIPKKGG